MQLSSIHRYPVKSMQGESLQSSPVGPGGLVGDRWWAVRDEKRGGIRGAKVIHPLMQFSARYPAALDLKAASDKGRVLGPEISLPDGRTVEAIDPEINDILSDALTHPVTLWPLQPPDNRDHYRRGAPVIDDMEQEFRRMFARDEDMPLPDLSAFPAELAEFESPPGTYFDAYPLLLVSQNSLEAVQHSHAERSPDTELDMRRFRPNLVLNNVLEDGKLETTWTGQRLRIGSCILKLEIPCPRCIMTTLPVGELERDPSIMRTLVEGFGGDFGIYASVEEAGTVSVGDTAHLL